MAKTLLVIDDSSTIREAIKLALTGEEWQLVCATDGAEATAALQENSVDAILCDVAPGEEDGYELCRSLGASAEGSGLPLLLMGASVNATAALAVGASATLPKPFEAAQLVQTLNDTLEQSDFTFDFDDVPAAPTGEFEDLSPAPTEDTPLQVEPAATELELQPAAPAEEEFDLDDVEVIDLSDDDEFGDLELLDDLQPVEVVTGPGTTEPADERDLTTTLSTEIPASTSDVGALDDLDLALDALRPAPIPGSDESIGKEPIAAPTADEITMESAGHELSEPGWGGTDVLESATASVDDMKIGFADESEPDAAPPPEDLFAPAAHSAPEPAPATEPIDQTPAADAILEPPTTGEFDLDLGVNLDVEPTPVAAGEEASGVEAGWQLPTEPIATDGFDVDPALDAVGAGLEEPSDTADEPLQVEEIALEDVLLQSTAEAAPEFTSEPEPVAFVALPEEPEVVAEFDAAEVPLTGWEDAPVGDDPTSTEPQPAVVEATGWDQPPAATETTEPVAAVESVSDTTVPDAPDLAAAVAADAGKAVREALEKSLSAEKLAPLIEAAVERVAWEVVPQLAERLIRETIEKLQQEPPPQ